MTDPETGAAVTNAGILTGVVALPFILYKVWQTLKSDKKDDNVDARIQFFTSGLQAQLDKALARADKIQDAYNTLVNDLAKAQARAESLAAENQLLRAQLQQLSSQAFSGSPK